ncbi:MAG: DUF4923 family protein [Bacteroidaceae bacterium]|nr:DUF4923 family protein [Bacteroidaceae bacterium]
MKKSSLFAAVMAATITLSSCGLTGASSGTTSSTGTTATDGLIGAGVSILNGLLGSVLASNITEQTFVGTWTYQAPECRFESESLLAQAGGEVMANTIEKKLDTYLSKIGIKKGVTSYTFNEDKTFSIQTSGRTVSTGTYTYDKSTKTLKLNGTLGLMNQSCLVGMDGTNLCLLYDADKLLTGINAIGSLLGKSNGLIGSVGSLLGNSYQGMKLGFQMSK